MRRFIGRDNLRKRLAPLEGKPGRTSYANAVVRIEPDLDGDALIVRPPFGLVHEGAYDEVRVAPLLAEVAADHLVAVLLVRLGGYAVGVFDGDRLVASKVGSRFVKNRHKAGGSSANRFRRRREEQAGSLIDEAAGVAVNVLPRGATGSSSRRSAVTAEESRRFSSRGPSLRGSGHAQSTGSLPCRIRGTAFSR